MEQAATVLVAVRRLYYAEGRSRAGGLLCRVRSSTFSSAIADFEEILSAVLRQNVESAEIPGSAFFEIVFIRVESGVPAVAYRSFFAERDPQKRLVVRTERTDCPGSGCPDGTDFRVLGKNLAYRDFLASKQKFSGIPIDDINRTIQMETEREPDEVGGNINIISIDGLGAKWITNYGECAGQ